MKPLIVAPDVQIAPALWVEFPDVIIISQGWLLEHMGPKQIPEPTEEPA